MINWFNNNQGFMSAILSVIGLIVSGIAICISIRTTQKQNKREVFEKRFQLYMRLREAMESCFIRNEDVTEFVIVFKNLRDEIAFLFDEKIHQYAIDVLTQAERLNNDKASIIEIRHWANEQLNQKKMRETFNRYLDLSSYGISK